MSPAQRVKSWIKENFNPKEVVIESYNDLPYGKKVTDYSSDFVIVFYDFKRERLNFKFKDQKQDIIDS